MRRREVLLLSVGAGLWSGWLPTRGTAQEPSPAFRIGVLGVGTSVGLAPRMDHFRQAMRELGWVNERDIRYVERYADGNYERLPHFAAELVTLKVDLILAVGGSPAILAAMNATKDVPIVFPTAADPVAQKLVASMAHPGGNVTGLSVMSSELYGKRLELLKEALPGIRRVGLLARKGNPNNADFVRVSRTAGQAIGLDSESFEVRQSRDYEGVFERMVRRGVHAVLIENDPNFEADLAPIGELAIRSKLPLVAGYRGRGPGVLITYGSSGQYESYGRAAYYADRILRGAKPGDLPVEQFLKVTLIVDLKTAKALGITIPQSLLLRADEVIE